MKQIPLTKGYSAIVDDEDFELVNQWKWTATEVKSKNHITVYARRTVRFEDGKQRTLLLHRFLMDAPKGVEVDHKNRNGLDCRRSNLRCATHSQNKANSPYPNKTGFRGVSLKPQISGRKFYARIEHNGSAIYIGAFFTAEAAALAYDKKAKEIFGEFAFLNFSER